MKILSLCCENINSLKGKIPRIELSEGLLADHGLFVISGPTGAGKSTLLDVICVSLYGKTPRLSQHTDHLMSKTAGFCWSEVEFEISDVRYRSRWELHRSRKKVDGSLQPSKMFLSRLNEKGDGEIIEEKTSKVPVAIQDLTGLDFQRFCRSMLLAQGEFDAFLKGSENERAELLEKMTGTEIYRDISILTYERCKQSKLLWEKQLHWQEQHLKNKSSREINRIDQDEKEVLLKKQNLKQEHEALTLRLSKAEYSLELERQMLELEKKRSAWESDDLSQNRKSWLEWKKIEPFEGRIKQLKVEEKECEHLRIEEAQLNEKIKNLKEKQSLVLEELSHKLLKLKDLKSKFEGLHRVQPKMLELQEALKVVDQQLNSYLKEKKTLEQDLTDLRDRCEANQQHIRELKDRMKSYEDLVQKSGVVEVQIQKLEDLKIIIGDSSDIKNLLFNHRNDLKDLELELKQLGMEQQKLNEERNPFLNQQKDLEEELKKKITEQEILLESIPVDWPHEKVEGKLGLLINLEKDIEKNKEKKLKYERLKEELQRFEEEKGLTEKKYSKLKLELEELKKIEQISFLEHQREKLKDGEACPLCGSKEHDLDSFKNSQSFDVDQLLEMTSQEKVLQEIRIQIDERLRFKLEELSQLNAELKEHDEMMIQLSDRVEMSGPLLEIKETLLKYENQYKESSSLEHEQMKLKASMSEANSACLSLASELEKLILKQSVSVKQIEQLGKVIKDLEVKLDKNDAIIKGTLITLDFKSELDEQLHDRVRQKIDNLNELKNDYESDVLKLNQGLSLDIKSKTQLDELSKQIERLKEQIQVAKKDSAQHRAERDSLYENPEFFFQDYQRYEKQLQDLKENIHQSEKIKLELEVKLIQSQEHLAHNQDKVTKKNLKFKSDQLSLLEDIQKRGFNNLDEIDQLNLDESNRKSLELWNTKHEDLGKELEYHSRRIKEASSEATEKEDLLLLKENLELLQSQLEQCEQSLGSLTRERKEEENWQKQNKQQLNDIVGLESDYLEWDQLNRLIGSATGHVFRKIAQRITLRFLLKLANRHLSTILERYQLKVDPERDMGLILQDSYQAMSVRPLDTLSGGERFMMSLALALALSDISRQTHSIESLFIDEGFGSLDVHALDRVLEALDKIRQMGRSIGIISHIEALKERIPAQIRVEPTQGGSSLVKVVGL